MKTTHAQSGLCVVFFAYACLTNVHTGETNEISTSTRERKMFLFLKLVLVLISCMFTAGFSCACAYLIHNLESGFNFFAKQFVSDV